MTRPAPSTLAAAALALVALAMSLIIALHFLEPQLDARTTYLSDYGETPHRGLLIATYVLLGVGGVLLGLALRDHLEGSLAAGAGGALLALAGAAVVGMVVWPVGRVHVGIVRVEEGMLLLSIGLMSYGLQDRPPRSLFFSRFSWLVVLLTAMGVFRVEQYVAWPGLLQRAYLLTVFVWVVLMGRLAMLEPRDHVSQSPSPENH